MPRRADLRKILVLGSGPIVIGQACEFDYSGAQGCRALREEGLEVVLVNSNPATIMTDPELADRTYVEPLVPAVIREIIRRERPDALLPTLGGQTALNLAMALDEGGWLAEHGVQLIGASAETIARAEDRARFKATMQGIGLDLPRSETVTDAAAVPDVIRRFGLPLVIRPSFTLGGKGGGVATTAQACADLVALGLSESPIGQVLIEEGLLGWKEFELEVMRDRRDNAVVVCSIENIDGMGVHTGDSWAVAPALTLSDREYQAMRDAALAAIRAIGVETGGANVQFAVHRQSRRRVIIEINPRVSRSSALASKATGFPIARLAAKLAIGYHLDELINGITGTTACFEPAIDYIVTKAPRFDFEKFGDAEGLLGTSMKAVGEAMAIGRTFKESFQKAIVSMDIGANGVCGPASGDFSVALERPCARRMFAVGQALAAGWPIEAIAGQTGIDPFFIAQIAEIVAMEGRIAAMAGKADACEGTLRDDCEGVLRDAKRMGFADARLAELLGISEPAVRAKRAGLGIAAVFKQVDTCAAEFAARTPYFYSSFDQEDEPPQQGAARVVILGGGPNRIGQGIEFDYCCVHAAQAVREAGLEAVMINCNPETVSTDHDTVSRLYFEPLTAEHVIGVVAREQPIGIILCFGGQTPLKLAAALQEAGIPVLGTSPAGIRRAEDREAFAEVLADLGLEAPPFGLAGSVAEALVVAERLGYPVIVRPSFVLGGRAMAIARDEAALLTFLGPAFAHTSQGRVLIDRFLDEALEVDVDAVADASGCRVAGIMEQLEPAGIHSGDSTCSLPPHTLAPDVQARLADIAAKLARALDIRGPFNVQAAIADGRIFVLEANPRAARTLPFVSKATGVAWAKAATRALLGLPIAEQTLPPAAPAPWAVKAPVFPFDRFPGCSAVLGPEMRSTGEAMGLGRTFDEALAKARLATGQSTGQAMGQAMGQSAARAAVQGDSWDLHPLQEVDA